MPDVNDYSKRFVAAFVCAIMRTGEKQRGKHREPKSTQCQQTLTTAHYFTQTFETIDRDSF